MKAFFSALGTTARVILGIIFLVTLYMIPTGIAVLRNHRNTGSIFLLDLLLGWTFIGWVVALVWSFSSQKPEVVQVVTQ